MKKSIGILTMSLILTTPGLFTQQASAATKPAGAISVKSKGAKADGKTNDLKAFQAAIAAVGKGGTVWVPAGKYLLDVSKSDNIRLKSNMKFAMDPNAVLTMKPNAHSRAYLIYTAQASNIEIYGGQLVGDRYKHLSDAGEWGFGIRISGGQHIRIHDMKISNMWGDGICTGEYPDDVVIQRVLSTNNRRQAISITTGTNIKVLDSELSFTNGTKPMYGIDIEPDNADVNYARNILIQGNYFHDNVAGGVQSYVNSQNVTIKNNRFSTGKEGVYMITSHGGVISGNTFDHLSDQPIHAGGETNSYQIYGNVFRRTNMTSPLTSITGLTGVAKNNIVIGSTSSGIKVGTNQYAK
jgi:parallel beta-helix repeat protein